MRLYGSAASPFVRKVRILATELELDDELEFILAEGTPLDASELRAKSPLKKIPFLEMDDGLVVYDSGVVAEALISSAREQKAAELLPPSGSARLEVLTRQSLVDGICDAAVGLGYELRLRPADKHWPEWMDAQWGKVQSGLDWFEAAERPEGRFDLGDCALAVLPIYLDFRFADRDWRVGRPRLTAWWEAVKDRPSIAATLR